MNDDRRGPTTRSNQRNWRDHEPRLRGAHAGTRVGLVYNLRRRDGDAREAEYDSEETVEAIAEAIASWGFEVQRMEATRELVGRLAADPPDVVFNIAEGADGRGREACVPAILEFLGIPYTGSDPAAMVVTLDKALAKAAVAREGVATPSYAVVGPHQGIELEGWHYPVIVKPRAEGSSKGIQSTSVVDGPAALEACVASMLERYPEGLMVEQFLAGREFTVGILQPAPRAEARPDSRSDGSSEGGGRGGEEAPFWVLPPMEIAYASSVDPPIYSYDVKQQDAGGVSFEVPARIDPTLAELLEDVAARAWRALGCRDHARIDLRLDASGRVHFLECNPLPGLVPGFSDLPLCAEAAGLSYRRLIAEMLAPALERRVGAPQGDQPVGRGGRP